MNIDNLLSQQDFDVCVIGSGPAGTVVSRDLSTAGIKVLLIESGTGMGQWLVDKKVQNLASYTFSGTTNYPLKKTKARLLGGNSNFWTGRSERLHPSDFEIHPYTPKDNPWPISYTDLCPYYARAEETLRVRAGPRSQYAPPRGDAQPLLPPSPNIDSLRQLVQPAGIVLDDSPTATPTKIPRFFSVQREILPTANADFLQIVKGFTVTKLETEGNKIVSAHGKATANGKDYSVKAKKFVVACGGIESPRLLLLSAGHAFPNGIGNHSDRVGRGFNEHPAVNFYGRLQHSRHTLPLTNRIGRTHQFYSDFREEGLGAVLPVIRQAWILPHHVMPFRLANVPKKMLDGLSRLARATFYVGVTIEQSISPSNRVTLSQEQDIFGNPKAHLHFDYTEEDLRLLDRCRDLCRTIMQKINATSVLESEVTWSRHHQGTCRMGADPNFSVVDPQLKVHHTDNLYVVGSETFVTGGAMQPVLTIVALAHRLAETLKHELA